MVEQRMDLLELLRKRGMDGDVDFLREALQCRDNPLLPPSSISMALHIPKLREGSYFPSLLEPRRRSEQALRSVIQQAYPSAGSGQAWRESPPEGWTT